MRLPFLLFIVLISIYCWLTDVINIIFYLFHVNSPHKNSYSAVTGSLLFLIGLVTWVAVNYKRSGNQFLKNIFQPHRKKEWLLLLLVSMPVIGLGLFRSVFPDSNFDTFHFELYLQEFDFTETKTNFGAAAIRTYYFPLPERVFGLFRHILGYRLGTILNTFLLVTIIASVYDFLKKVLTFYSTGRNIHWIIPALLSLFIIFADNTFFTIGSYKPDLIGIPFLLEMIHFIFFKKQYDRKTTDHFIFFLIASLTLTYKLTYLPYVGILCLIYFIQNFKVHKPLQTFAVPLTILAFPAIYLLYNEIETGNPIFPFFNKLFHSTLFPAENWKDSRWGYQKTYELFIYPVVTLINKNRCNEWALYSYRLLFGYFISIGSIVYYLIQVRKQNTNEFIRIIFFTSLLAIALDYSCCITTGYYRYGVIVEVLYGIIISLWLLYLQNKIALALILAIALFQVYDTTNNIYIKNVNLSWHNYNLLLHDKKIRKTNMSRMLSDYNTIIDKSNILPKIDAFVSMEPFAWDGLSKLLNNKVPIYDLTSYGRTPDSIKQFEKNIIRPQSQTKNIFVVANNESIDGGMIEALNKKGYLVANMYEVYPEFVQPNEPVYLFKIVYYDSAKFTIKTGKYYLKDENTPDLRNDFKYKSANKVKAFIREAPFVYNWSSLPDKYDLVINGARYKTNNRFTGNKTFTVQSDSVIVHKSENVPYLIFTQEIVGK